jgi:hypothetical protein
MTEDEINAVLSRLQFSEPEAEAPRSRLSEVSLSRPSIDESFPVTFSPSRGNIAPMASSMMSMMPSATGRVNVPAFGGELSAQGGYLPIRGAPPMTHHGFSFEKRFAGGGEVDAALHTVRQHFDEGGFLDSLRNYFSSDGDYQSAGGKLIKDNGEVNWGDPESAADFFRADKARMALDQRPAVGEPGGDVTGSTPQPLRRPAPEAAPRQPIAAPAPVPAIVPPPTVRPIATLPIGDVEPHDFPPITTPSLAFGQPIYGEKTQRLGGDEGQNRAPAVQMDYTLGNAGGLWPSSGKDIQTYAGKVPENFNEDFGNTMSINDVRQSMMLRPASTPQAAVNRAVSLAQNVVAPQDETPTFEQALANVEKLHNAKIFSGPDLDKAGEMLAAHLRARDAGVPVGEALRLIRAEGPPMVNQGMPQTPETAGTRRDIVPLSYAATPAPAPAVDAIDQATGKLTARMPEEPHGTALTKQQADYIVRTIAAETSGKSPEETRAIASVILNRINSGKYGASPEAVLFAKRQFEPWMSRASANYPMKISPTSQRYSDARDALEAAMAGEDITGGATHFWGPKAQFALGREAPSWGRTGGVDIGETRFHKLERADGGEIHGEGTMSHDDIVSRALHAARRHFNGLDGSYVDPMGNVAYGDNNGPVYPGDTLEAPQGYITPATAVEWKSGDAGPYAVDAGGNTLPLIRQPGVLPLYRDPTIDSVRMAMPGMLDVVGNVTGAPAGISAARLARAAMAGERPVEGVVSAMGAKPPIKKSADLPSIRDLPVDEAIKIARKEQHLIPTEAGNPNSGFVGGPRDIENKRQLNKLRKNFDTYIGADPRGGDWYDRYRAAVNEVTGGDPVSNTWMTSQEGQWSAGVSPQSELAFALKENNAAIAGMPVKAARPAQFEAHNRAIEMKDPSEMQLGKKTGEYARLINPDQLTPPGATGVNDFRHARNFNYTEAGGDAQRAALTGTQHSFLDYETALAVDRARKSNLGGRSDWTGEQLQAAPWVRQKALDILEQRPAIFERHLAEQLALAKAAGLEGDAAMASATSQAKKLAYEEAFQDANSTIADFYDKHTAFATHEAQPGSVTQHLPGSVNASQEQRNAFAADPRSSWAFAPGERDAIYSGLGIPDTGVYMRVRPTKPMQGMYETPAGVLETNPGEVARPLVAFNSGKAKSVSEADRALLNAGEATRAYIDAQNAGAWHKPWAGGADNLSTSYFLPMDRPATVDELIKLRKSLSPYGLGDVLDTGQGITATSFYPGAPQLSRKTRAEVERAIELARPEGATGAQRVKIEPGIDTGYLSYEKEFANRGSGDATRELLKQVNQTPEIRRAFDQNPYIPQKALANISRDKDWIAKWGVTNDDIQRSREIIGKGPGWVGRLEQALKDGVILPAIGAALLAPLAGQQDNGG